MMAGSREVRVSSPNSVLDEMLGSTSAADEDEATTEAPPRRRSRRTRQEATTTETSPAPEPEAGTERSYTGADRPSPQRDEPSSTPGPGTRPDPEGMRRWSLYAARPATEAFDAAVERLQRALGDDVPKHVVVSAMIAYAADHADEVQSALVADRAEQLQRQLRELQNQH